MLSDHIPPLAFNIPHYAPVAALGLWADRGDVPNAGLGQVLAECFLKVWRFSSASKAFGGLYLYQTGQAQAWYASSWKREKMRSRWRKNLRPEITNPPEFPQLRLKSR